MNSNLLWIFFSFCCAKAKRETVTKYCSLNDTNRFAFQNRATSFVKCVANLVIAEGDSEFAILLFLPETEGRVSLIWLNYLKSEVNLHYNFQFTPELLVLYTNILRKAIG